MERFNYSTNSAAINVGTNKFVATTENINDIFCSQFMVNEKFNFSSADLIPMLKDYDSMVHYYHFQPESNSTLVLNTWKREKYNDFSGRPENVLSNISDDIIPYIPPNRRGWLTRGVVRSALLGCLNYWDDYDVIVECTENELRGHLRDVGAKYIEKFFHFPKVTLSNGRKMDIWSIEYGTIESVLKNFSHQIDSVGWSIQDKCLVDPIGGCESLKKKILKFSPYTPSPSRGENALAW